ncbi:MAG TPA: DUF5947 family protein [Candidatus Saccharimonadales bacterium]|nr:DUF5947 family protein [Candidatus Saccharimonadales bacterium]
MSDSATPRSENAVNVLRRIAQPRVVEEQCEFCSVPIAPIHRHLLETAKHKIICACDPCALRFESVVNGRFKLVPRDARLLPNFCLTDGQWDAFALPINLTFFYRDTLAGKMVAMYPSPAGATESLLPADNWKALEADNPALAKMESDVEALLVNRIGAAREYFITPIDMCYELVGLIRMHWRGFTGGEKVWQEIDGFFAALREKTGASSATATEVLHA